MKVADCGSFTRAAIELDTAHSGLSRQVLDLETQLGYRLFHRTGRGVKLTEAGRRLYEHSMHLIAVAGRLEDEARALKGVVTGTVAVGMPGSIAQLIASPLLVSLTRSHPLVKTRVVEGLSGMIEEQLASGRLDIGMFFSYDEKLRAGRRLLFLSDLYLIGPRGDRLTRGTGVRLAQLEGIPLVLPGEPHSIRQMLERSMAKRGIRATVKHEIESMSTMKRLVEDGVGYAVSTWSSVAAEVAGKRLSAARIIDPVLTRGLALARARNQPPTAAASVVEQEILRLVMSLVKQGSWKLRLPPASASRS